ncbi:hypothetical protein ACGFZQ_47050 [Streptomyces sp. NPDC048254]|uniref:hypothetical protein n=1 Tax=Streptomyces sp. NPDC048254 TaxID=3365525 RepID=UPI00371E358D
MTTTPTPPSDYRLMLPDGWFRVALEPERRERSVDALVKRQFNGTDDVPHLRQLLREEMLERATDAYDAGGVELYLSLQRAGALTIPASLLITLLPWPKSGRAPSSLGELAAGLGGDGRTASLVELAAGRALRLRRDPEAAPAAPPTAEENYALPSVTVDYQLIVPGSDMHLLLTFSTPLVQIAEAMVELFDAVAGSLTWLDGDATHE